ncbi:MAG: hypothetical protein QM796_09575 [Chthoniobacteraceae bacterium]
MTTDSELNYRPAMRLRFPYWVICLGSFATLPLLSAAPPAGALSPKDLSQAATVDSLTIPTPGESLAALGKDGKPNWKDEYRAPIPTAYTSRPQAALDLGSLIADGYIAVEAEDAQQVKNTGRDIISIAKTLGVSQTLINRGNSIADFAENNEWNTLKEELEATQNEVKMAMEDQHDDELVTLVTTGGWIRGVEAVTDWISKNYSPDAASLIRQPGIANFLLNKINQLPVKTQSDSIVRLVKDRLQTIQKLVSFPSDKTPSLDDVKQLHKLTSELVQKISEKP